MKVSYLMPVRNCDICKYSTNVKFNYDKHMTSKRHLERCKEDNRCFECHKCQKPYSTRSGVWKHENMCKVEAIREIEPSDTVIMMTRMMEKLDHVEETNGKLLATIESMKTQIGPSNVLNTLNNTVNNNTNNHITVNELKIYLNTECKDAKTILDFIDNLNLTVNERCELELMNYNSVVSKIWKRNYLALPEKERPLYCVPTAESECTVFAKGDETWQEQKEDEFLTKLEIKPKNVTDTMLATTAVHETCNKICELYDEKFSDDDIVTRLTPKTKGPEREEWNQRKTQIWTDACKLDAELREKVSDVVPEQITSF